MMKGFKLQILPKRPLKIIIVYATTSYMGTPCMLLVSDAFSV